MQQGMHNTIELQRVERELLDRALQHHHLLVEERMRHRRPGRLAKVAASFHTLFAPRPVMREERGV